MYVLNKNEQKLLTDIENSFYMQPSLKRVQTFVKEQGGNPKKAWQEVFNYIYTILVEAKNEVEVILEERKAKGKIKDIRQAIKSIAGNTFSNLIIYIFLYNKIIGNIRSNIFITNKKSEVKNFAKIATIYVDGEKQNPDVDLIIFTKKADQSVNSCIILSLKTSLRERAGQTYKWKLLMEIASGENAVKSKYNITYDCDAIPLICFATVNFYDEINNPQHRGMFKFFDQSFIAKPVKQSFLASLSELVKFTNEKL